jgi:hypothetical protein
VLPMFNYLWLRDPRMAFCAAGMALLRAHCHWFDGVMQLSSPFVDFAGRIC